MRLKLTLFMLALLISLFMCSSTTALEHRLPQHIQLQHQSIHLHVDPDKATFSGTTTLNIMLTKPTHVVAYHGKGLTIDHVSLIHQGKETPLSISAPDHYEIIKHDLPTEISGIAKLKIAYRAQISEHVEGLYRVQNDQGQIYLLSQFQSMEARRVFPTFDEPDKKATFAFKITTPKSYTVLHNTLPSAIELKGKLKTTQFAKTPKMNTDILALALGQFAEYDVAKSRLNTKVFSPKKSQVKVPAYFKEVVDGSLTFIEDYLNSPFPFERLDFVVGNFGSVAAMENLGLVALNENQVPTPDATPRAHCQFKKLIAHEIAHSWFGNDITMAWYDDYWLNESFTEFIAAKVVQTLYPETASCTYVPQAKAFNDDNQHATPLIFDVKTREDTVAYGQLYYTKGRAILDMLEQAYGTETLQQRLQLYVKKFTGKNVSTRQFLALLPDTKLQNMIASFTQNTGYPLITMTKKDGHYMLAQNDILNRNDMLWTIPVSLKLWDGKQVSTQKLILEDAELKITLPANVHSIFLNTGGAGYFRYVDNTGLNEFPFDKLSPPEQASYRDNQQSLAISGHIEYLAYIDSVVRELNQIALDSEQANTLINELHYVFIDHIQLGHQQPFARYLSTQITHQPDWAALLKKPYGGDVLQFFGLYLKAPDAIKAAIEYYNRPNSHQHPHFDKMIAVLASSTTNTQYKQFVTQFKQMPSQVKDSMLPALGYVDNAEKVKLYYDLLIDDATKGMVIDVNFQYPAFNPALRVIAADLIAKRKEAIFARIAPAALQWFPYSFITSCSKAQQQAVSKLFKNWLHIEGLEEKLNVVLHNIEQCTARSKKISQSLTSVH
ncbi:M1 family aminopeptidase [Pseudoalteromonas luteoviolacea]|uniref:Aminopeptidase N n=1 Tax=Pseudoalteromonas luteoviolacea S4054 TaxID=1129367 RepID=A0A0F6A4X3_9GAMM|nr:M1 family aminopeptidase [Pseudoalteromonas luteoviolacea]AOT07686.1 hypothetical protein S4054249_07430 [Pseudoalteromonas luteoviolacea]AOT12602.1 hypothetical protein S40542_07430 [Pseudoalteromonas luteoviolacea]AOT17516.1 hypothetical protein S4054_07430 [Pseudoalteromonas luteoviolacea]KKE81222.1 hypothetical protein N479_23355 [Pseudoalteromonas luteoviolacea S4054]KZN66350.1 hypothetical protein N481_24450 [Pseudoalteromonas luteoviolacea S4047-1]